jgi:phosphatidylinositol glycan class N
MSLRSCIFRSFYLAPVYRLVPVFNPFLMAALLVRPFTSGPFSLISQFYPDSQDRRSLRRALRRVRCPQRSSPPSSVLTVPRGTHAYGRFVPDPSLCQPTADVGHTPPLTVMTLTFFFRVTDTGSWLEIGQSITFFCISSMLLVWSAGICGVGEMLMGQTRRLAEEGIRIKTA